MDILVGYTGFVGSNIAANRQFDMLFNSKNIEDSFGANPDFCIYSGIPAEKFLANQNEERDFEIIKTAITNIKKINPKRLLLISTVDVYKNPVDVTEDNPADGTDPYGKNRLYLENWCAQNIENLHIIRLPGLFGENIKKNFIYDMINFIPSALKAEKFLQLASLETIISESYYDNKNGFYKLSDNANRDELKKAFVRVSFSALNFTDSRACFQLYNLQNLACDIKTVVENDIKLINLATEPLCAADIYKAVFGSEFKNEFATALPRYDFKTKHCEIFGGKDGYICGKDTVLNEIVSFVRGRI